MTFWRGCTCATPTPVTIEDDVSKSYGASVPLHSLRDLKLYREWNSRIYISPGASYFSKLYERAAVIYSSS
jgi:hypothetical protein